MIALVLALIATHGSAQQGDAWAQLWTELEALRTGRFAPGEASLFRTHLQEAVLEAGEGPRSELLRASLEALDGGDARLVALRLARLEPSPFTTRELWLLADLLPSGVERTRAVREALATPSALSFWQVLLAWNIGVDEARALRLEEAALPIQRALHERSRAPWSAEDLSLTLRVLGRREEAEQVLQETIASEEAAGRTAPGLWEKRGLIALGFGDDPAARDYLGRALSQGSSDAGLVLARMDLQVGQTTRARRGFRALILEQPPSDWAWRGWGMALLPPAPSAPVPQPPSTPDE